MNLHIERLEDRRLLASDLGQISGTVLNDLQNDSNTANDVVVAALPVTLYRDGNANGLFDGAATDAQVDSTTTDASGNYTFTGLTEGTYFVQITPTSGQQVLSGGDLQTISFNASEAMGATGLTIDDFSTVQTITASRSGSDTGTTDASSADGANATDGGVRDLYVEATTVGNVSLTSQFGGSNILSLESSSGTEGIARVSWDGADGDGDAVDENGLSLDFSDSGNNFGMLLNVSADSKPGAEVTVRLTSGSGNSAEATVSIQDQDGLIDGDADEQIVIPFTAFTENVLGTGIDFTDVTAIEVELDFRDPSINGLDARIEVVGVMGYTTKTADFSVLNRMSIGDQVFADFDNDGVLDPGETGIEDVVVSLYEDTDSSGDYTPGDVSGHYDPATDSGATITFSGGADTQTDVASTFSATTTGGENFDISFASGVGSSIVITGDASSGYTVTIGQDYVGDLDSVAAVINANISEISDASFSSGSLVLDMTQGDNASIANVVNITGGTEAGAVGTLAIDITTDDNIETYNGYSINVTEGGGSTDTVTAVLNVGGSSIDINITGTVTAQDIVDAISSISGFTASFDATNSAAGFTALGTSYVEASDSPPGVAPTLAGGDSGASTLSPATADLDLTLNQAAIAGSVTGGSAFAIDTAETDATATFNGFGSTPTGTFVFNGTSAFVGASGNNLTVAFAENNALPVSGSTATLVGNTLTITIGTDDGSADDTPIDLDAVFQALRDNSETDFTDIFTYSDGADVLLATDTTDSLGNYLFEDLTPGDYILRIAESLFDSGEPLEGLVSSTGNESGGVAPDADDNVDDDDNGYALSTFGVVTQAITLVGDAEPTTDGDADANTNLAVDFGFYGFDLTITKDVDMAAVSPGSTLTYTAVVTNNGPSNAYSLAFTDTLPADVTFTSGSSDSGTGTVSHSSGTVTADLGDLAPGASATVTIIVAVDNDATGTLTNTASVAAANESNTSNNSDTAATSVEELIDLQVTKVDDDADADVAPGDTVVYTIDVTNNGPSTATNVVLTDTLPDDVTFNAGSSTPSPDTNVGGVLTYNLGTLASGASTQVIVSVTIDNDFIGTITNTATVTATESESNSANNTAAASSTVAVETSSIEGYVYVDSDNDGVFDPGEAPIAGVTITLTGIDFTSAAVNQTTTTDSNGRYQFSSLLPGTYQVTETDPAFYPDGQDTAGSAGGSVADDDISNITIGSGVEATAYNFGELPPTLSKRRFLASSL
ncbi:SdrD B-like domain-containing protein [Aeoliella mucimassa]|uniref:Serine-aspartate repeat-containing protein D n=1 Tax=Aeoliella mucimassa TaxID=2527972 RepID=A0A518ASK4_9BACT|nr:SdrD B-like domain-containing protein [Aeoliella mucimassa]QDU57686.1 Serine-aspartate repeat-containing protein D precursor [Aeoliella mucimassa]